MHEIYERLKKICKDNGTNITALCKEITGSTGNSSTWVKGNIRNDYLLKISEKFNVSTDYLLCKTDDPKSTVATPQGDVINIKQEESKTMEEKNYVTKEEIAEILEAYNAKIIEAMDRLIKERMPDSENAQDNYLEVSGEN